MYTRNALFAAALCCLPSLVLAGGMANLLPNGDFSSSAQLTGWRSDGFGVSSWTSDDANGTTGSGSMQLDTNLSPGVAMQKSACFAVTPGAAYSAAISTKLIGGILPHTSFLCTAYTSTACTTAIVTLEPYPQSTPTAIWTASSVFSGTLPVNAQSVDCILYFSGGIPSAAGSARLDNASFNSIPPTTPVSLQSFEVN